MTTLMDTETGDITGTPDKDYNIIWFTERCLSNALRLEVFVKDADRAGDRELRSSSARPSPRAAKAPSKARCSLSRGPQSYPNGDL